MEKFVISDNRLFKVSWEELDAKSIYMKRVKRDDVSRVKAVVWSEEDSVNGTIKVADKEETLKTILPEVRQLFSKVLVLPTFKIDDEDHWINDLGGDSMNYVEVVQEIDRVFDIEIPEEKYGQLTCVNDFVEEIARLKK